MGKAFHLLRENLLLDGSVMGIEPEGIGIECTRDEALAHAVDRAYHIPIKSLGQRIACEQHPGLLWVDHLLQDHCDGDLLHIKMILQAVDQPHAR